MLRFFLLSIFSSLILVCFSQKRTYDIFFFGEKIGNVHVEKKNLGNDSVDYSFNSYTDFSFLFMSMKTKAITKLSYHKGLLQSAYVLRNKDDKSQELNYLWDKNKYIVKETNKEYSIEDEIYFCSANFFLDEPIDIKEVFIERFNYFVEIEKLGVHQYKTKVDGGTNIYTYENGVLQSVKSTKGLTVNMKLVE